MFLLCSGPKIPPKKFSWFASVLRAKIPPKTFSWFASVLRATDLVLVSVATPRIFATDLVLV